jgi:hypothetical protein
VSKSVRYTPQIGGVSAIWAQIVPDSGTIRTEISDKPRPLAICGVFVPLSGTNTPEIGGVGVGSGRSGGGWAVHGLTSSWSGDSQGAVGLEVEVPAAFVGEVVMSHAEWEEVVDVGGSTVLPRVEVVDFAVLECGVTQRAGRVDNAEGTPLVSAGEPLATAQQESGSFGSDDRGCDSVEAGPASDRLHGEAVVGEVEPDLESGAFVASFGEGAFVDDDGDVRSGAGREPAR